MVANVLLKKDSSPHLTLIKLKWSQDFRSTEYMTSIQSEKTRFASVTQRTAVLNTAGLGYNNNMLGGVLYGAMLKWLLGVSTSFTQQTNIVALVMQWYEKGGHLRLAAIPVDENADSGSIPFPDPGNLYSLLESNQGFDLPFEFDAEDLLIPLGFQSGSLPTHSVNKVSFHPIIVHINPQDPALQEGDYFALAMSLSRSAHSHAYDPPCPPYCY